MKKERKREATASTFAFPSLRLTVIIAYNARACT